MSSRGRVLQGARIIGLWSRLVSLDYCPVTFSGRWQHYRDHPETWGIYSKGNIWQGRLCDIFKDTCILFLLWSYNACLDNFIGQFWVSLIKMANKVGYYLLKCIYMISFKYNYFDYLLNIEQQSQKGKSKKRRKRTQRNPKVWPHSHTQKSLKHHEIATKGFKGQSVR